MTNLSRHYYERELDAGYGPSPNMKEGFGYSEPLRRLIQRESFEPQANEIPNTMPSWLPDDDYMTNFKVGDPFVKIDDGYARLPGAGYEAIHPELKGVDPEDYPDTHKLRILADVAPYSGSTTRSFRPLPQTKPSRTRGRLAAPRSLLVTPRYFRLPDSGCRPHIAVAISVWKEVGITNSPSSLDTYGVKAGILGANSAPSIGKQR